MKKLLSSRYSASAFNIALFILRVGTGILTANHGFEKLANFKRFNAQFINFMGMGTKVSLSLAIFAEFFCSILLILGLMTRLAVIPLIVVMSVATFMVYKGDVFAKAELPAVFLLAFIAILFVGPGRISVDSAINK